MEWKFSIQFTLKNTEMYNIPQKKAISSHPAKDWKGEHQQISKESPETYKKDNEYKIAANIKANQK